MNVTNAKATEGKQVAVQAKPKPAEHSEMKKRSQFGKVFAWSSCLHNRQVEKLGKKRELFSSIFH